MVRDFEDEIVRRTGASLVETPSRALPGFISRRVAHGTRYSAVRQWVPRGQFELAADVLWVPLMGPEDFELDLFAGWDRRVGVKILYFFDTFEAQLPAIRRVLAATSWDFVSTAFTDAKPFLEARTQRPWHIIPQGVRLERFRPAPTEERVIDFSAYGRRLQPVHEAVRRFCAASKKYYDYTTSAQVQAPLDAREHYAQYAWHLSHSVFTFCWPVETTRPGRATSFSPITCRWFEAAASGTVVIGQPPRDPEFCALFGDDAVVEIDPEEDVSSSCTRLWQNRAALLAGAAERRAARARAWSWASRIVEIGQAAGIPLSGMSGAARTG
jgi:hypothetical protein